MVGLPPGDLGRWWRLPVDPGHSARADLGAKQTRLGGRWMLAIAVVLLVLAAWGLLAGAWWSVALGVIGLLGALALLAGLWMARMSGRRPFHLPGQVVPGLVVEAQQERTLLLVLADQATASDEPVTFGLRAIEYRHAAPPWPVGTRVPCLTTDAPGGAAPVEWATPAPGVLRAAEQVVPEQEWELLGRLAAMRSGAWPGERPEPVPADLVPDGLRRPGRRVGIEVVWDADGVPHPQPPDLPPATTRPDPPAVPGVSVGEGPGMGGGHALRHLHFPADRAHAWRHNETFRAFNLPVIRVVAGAGVLAAMALPFLLAAGGAAGTVLAVLAVLVLLAAAVALWWGWRRKLLLPHAILERGVLNTGMVASVRPDGGAVVLALVDVTLSPAAPTRYLLRALEVDGLGGQGIAVGEPVPVTCTFSPQGPPDGTGRVAHFGDVEAVPIAWGTADRRVLAHAVAALPLEEWAFLASNLQRWPLVLAAGSLLLAPGELPARLIEFHAGRPGHALPRALDADFVLRRAWPREAELAHGLRTGYLLPDDARAIVLRKGGAGATIDGEDPARLWQYLVLDWIDRHAGDLHDWRETLDVVIQDVGYPDELRHLVTYRPWAEPRPPAATRQALRELTAHAAAHYRRRDGLAWGEAS